MEAEEKKIKGKEKDHSGTYDSEIGPLEELKDRVS